MRVFKNILSLSGYLGLFLSIFIFNGNADVREELLSIGLSDLDYAQAADHMIKVFHAHSQAHKNNNKIEEIDFSEGAIRKPFIRGLMSTELHHALDSTSLVYSRSFDGWKFSPVYGYTGTKWWRDTFGPSLSSRSLLGMVGCFPGNSTVDAKIIVSFRGTQDHKGDWHAANANLWAKWYSDGLYAHSGYLNFTESLLPNLFKQIEKCENEFNGKTFQLHFTGHSLGAAVATLSASRLIETRLDLVPYTAIKVIAFASPKVGDTKLQNYFQSLSDREYLKGIHLKYQDDWIPNYSYADPTGYNKYFMKVGPYVDMFPTVVIPHVNLKSQINENHLVFSDKHDARRYQFGLYSIFGFQDYYSHMYSK